MRSEIHQRTGKKPAVIISDSFGRAWRLGTVDVAIGVAGMKPIKDERGARDRYGYQLKAAVAAVADEIAAAAELVMGKRAALPVVLVRGFDMEKRRMDRRRSFSGQKPRIFFASSWRNYGSI